MAAKPVEKPVPHAEAEQASAEQSVQPTEAHGAFEHVASPAHALQARIAESFSKPYHGSGRRVVATVLVLFLSTWIAGLILYAALL